VEPAVTELQLIERLCSDFAYYADHGDAESLGNLFGEDGILKLGDQESVGRSNIVADCQARFDIAGRKTRHLWSNLRLVALTPEFASTTMIQLTFESRGPAVPTRLRVSDVSDKLRRDEDGAWHYTYREIRRELDLCFGEEAIARSLFKVP
jgi:hypothetical protein